MSDDVAGFVYTSQHAAQQDRSASIWRQSHVCVCGRGAASDGDRTREAEVGDGGRGCGRRRATVSHRSWRRARATGLKRAEGDVEQPRRRATTAEGWGNRQARVRGEHRRELDTIERGGVGQWRATANTSAVGGEVPMVLVHRRSRMIMCVPATYPQPCGKVAHSTRNASRLRVRLRVAVRIFLL
jgi:hypothetical protein